MQIYTIWFDNYISYHWNQSYLSIVFSSCCRISSTNHCGYRTLMFGPLECAEHPVLDRVVLQNCIVVNEVFVSISMVTLYIYSEYVSFGADNPVYIFKNATPPCPQVWRRTFFLASFSDSSASLLPTWTISPSLEEEEVTWCVQVLMSWSSLRIADKNQTR